MKGNELEYTKNLGLLVNLDLSSNCLMGQIPEEMTSLSGLRGFNLSNNNLTGKIPKNIGNLDSLESLDFSCNHLSGMIPPSISELHFLGYLDLSYNNLSGKIPNEHQLLTFNASSFEGNQGLCGAPLQKNCTEDNSDEPRDSDERMKEEDAWFYICVIMGFVVGFWIVCLFFKKTWRYAYFRFVENIYDRLS
ncbi:lysine--tRNA ligase [Ranunculus cassubicifolius]